MQWTCPGKSLIFTCYHFAQQIFKEKPNLKNVEFIFEYLPSVMLHFISEMFLYVNIFLSTEVTLAEISL